MSTCGECGRTYAGLDFCPHCGSTNRRADGASVPGPAAARSRIPVRISGAYLLLFAILLGIGCAFMIAMPQRLLAEGEGMAAQPGGEATLQVLLGGAPAANATVLAGNVTLATTDDNGTATFRLPAGQVEVTIQARLADDADAGDANTTTTVRRTLIVPDRYEAHATVRMEDGDGTIFADRLVGSIVILASVGATMALVLLWGGIAGMALRHRPAALAAAGIATGLGAMAAFSLGNLFGILLLAVGALSLYTFIRNRHMFR
ncbi:MAG TPA: hypothetical protein VFH47_06720 [Candidatus Thermoplasmatota archaeon]|nr:hypothetical protein [Candidatus Thermoplasmatota archaeon]